MPQPRRDKSLCRDAPDLYSSDARKLIGRIAAAFLDEKRLIPTELLHSYPHALALADAGTTLTGYVQQVAIAQVKDTNKPVGDRVRELFTYTDAALQVARGLSEVAAAAPALTVQRLGELAANEDDLKPAYAALAHHLAGAAGWEEKMSRVVALFAGAATPAVPLLDQVLAEFLARAPALALVLAGAPNAEARIVGLLALARREAVPDGVPLRTQLAALFARIALPACHAVLIDHAMQDLAANHGLTTGKPADELDAMRRVKAAFGRGGLPLPEAVIAALIDKRMTRAVTTETLADLVGQTAPMMFRLERTIELIGRVSGIAPREILLKYPRFLIEQRDLAKELEPSRLDDEAHNARLDKLVQSLLEANVPAARKETFLERLRAAVVQARSGGKGRGPAQPGDFVMIKESRMTLHNWSAIGLLFGPVAAGIQIAPPQQVRVTVSVRTDRGPLTFDADATVMRIDDGEVAAKYKCIKQADDKIIKGYFERRAQKKAQAS
ncbi:MAG: hypothetical protein EXQ92_04780 [Alphaproteobacteria bacterium]|nr:hypothetical protein [Alphaproteobacteria bacterium]